MESELTMLLAKGEQFRGFISIHCLLFDSKMYPDQKIFKNKINNFFNLL